MRLRDSHAGGRIARERCGFTLVEVMVALLVSGVVVLGARMMLEQLGDEATRILRYAAHTDRDANAERQLRALTRRLEIATTASSEFGGDEQSAHFSSWCDVPGGWQERCAVTLAVDVQSEKHMLVARLSTGEELIVRDRFERCELRYLKDASVGGTWFRSWGTGISAPIAIGVIVDRDTLILRIGERG